MSYAEEHLAKAAQIIDKFDPQVIEKLVEVLLTVRQRGGRLFFLGSGGGAGHASHAVNDFRKIAGIESYSPSDNVSELTARVNDEGWESCYADWLKGSHLRGNDAIFVFSVGGGNLEHNVSPNLVRAVECAREVGAAILGIVGRDGGYTARVADACVVVPTVNPKNVTAHTESFQALLWHLLVSHPSLQVSDTKWESVT